MNEVKPVKSGTCKRQRVVSTGRKSCAINISTERFIRRGYLQQGLLVEETAVYEMACDFPRTDSNFFGNGEYYAEEETSGAWWIFKTPKQVKSFINIEFNSQ
jgi:hypothetical protein